MKNYFIKSLAIKYPKKDRTPDKRITITTTIILVEFKDGRDLVLDKSDMRAQKILQTISL